MWWDLPRLKHFPELLPPNILDVMARAYAAIEVGGLSGYGPERGRNFEQLFYGICARRGVNLCEKAPTDARLALSSCTASAQMPSKRSRFRRIEAMSRESALAIRSSESPCRMASIIMKCSWIAESGLTL